MTFAWDGNNGLLFFILNLILILLVYGFLFFAVLKVSKRTLSFILLIGSFVLFLTSFIFMLYPAMILVAVITLLALILTANANPGDVNKFLANPFKRATAKSGNFGVEKIFDSKELYKRIETAVLSLSTSKTGAIITFERTQSLKNLSRNGVDIYAPVTSELLCTIFYPGTKLHDGAVIIHGNEIISAAVFFVPTTQPLAVSYGSRHRAAIGISEVSDAITVVVSEETGRISIAANGQLDPVDQDNFLRVFETYMSDDIDEEE
mgnify:CR=1 FL=1